MKRFIPLIIIGALLISGTHIIHTAQASEKTVEVFFNEACKDCGELVKETYPALFGEYGYKLELHDYINERSNRTLLTQANETWGVPFELQSHIEAFLDDRLLIGGHVPEQTIRTLLEHPDAYDRLLVYQDAMHGEETEYRVWDFEGEIKTYPIEEPIQTYLQEEKTVATPQVQRRGFWNLFAVITSSAFLDGLNPCAFAVLLFFISFLFTIKRTRATIWKMGLVYIGSIYLAYLLIGLGIAQTIIISGSPHLMAKIGAYLVIGLGIIQLLGVVFPAFGGFLVGLCTFPCSGGIYVAIIGMVTTQRTALQGTGWMLWYNLIFVSPLLILLALAANPKSTQHLQKLERTQARHMKILLGAFMIALGAVILIFFT